jgi:anaerobic magnesium-protoporphyrin IX monomethyl ester cyclase
MCLTRMREVAYEILEASRQAGAIVLANGSDASDHAGEYLHAGFSGVLLGEAEWTLLDAVRQLLAAGEGALPAIAGIAYLDRSSQQVIENPRRPLMRDLDQLPMPARDLVDIDQYRQAWRQAHGVFSLNLVSSRGCPYQCNWCAKPIYGDSFAVRSPKSVAEEISELKFRFGADHLWFADDIFGLRPRWVKNFAEEIERRDAAVPFKMQSRVDLMTRGTVEALRRAGCTEVWMGVESGSQKILNAMEKGTRVEQVLHARENLRREGIRSGYFLQFGYPGETWDDILKTVDLVRTTRPDDVGVSVSYPLPGTKFFDRVQQQLGAKTNWADSGDISMMFQGAYTDQFYRALHDYLHAEVDSWSVQRESSSNSPARKPASADPAALWKHVAQLQRTSRRAIPAPSLRLSEELVQLQPARSASAG